MGSLSSDIKNYNAVLNSIDARADQWNRVEFRSKPTDIQKTFVTNLTLYVMDVMVHYCYLAVFRFNINKYSMVVKELSLFPSESIFMGSYINLDLNKMQMINYGQNQTLDRKACLYNRHSQ